MNEDFALNIISDVFQKPNCKLAFFIICYVLASIEKILHMQRNSFSMGQSYAIFYKLFF
jgi:hypothetical protein